MMTMTTDTGGRVSAGETGVVLENLNMKKSSGTHTLKHMNHSGKDRQRGRLTRLQAQASI